MMMKGRRMPERIFMPPVSPRMPLISSSRARHDRARKKTGPDTRPDPVLGDADLNKM
jgi:hypothetical protein